MDTLPNEPTGLYSFITSLKGKIILLVISLIIVIVLGISFYNRLSKLTQSEIDINKVEKTVLPDYYEGKVSYIGDQGNSISYSLLDSEGKEILLLKSTDEKLKIVEGLKVKVYGTLIRGTNTQKDILVVKEILINNGTN